MVTKTMAIELRHSTRYASRMQRSFYHVSNIYLFQALEEWPGVEDIQVFIYLRFELLYIVIIFHTL